MEGLELISFQIIASSGEARSSYLQALRAAKRKDAESAKRFIDEANEQFNKAHEAHAQLIMKEAGGEKTEVNLLLVHAEDQMMSVEIFKILAEEELDSLLGAN